MGAFCNTRNDFYTKKTVSVIRRSEKGNLVVDRKVDGADRGSIGEQLEDHGKQRSRRSYKYTGPKGR